MNSNSFIYNFLMSPRYRIWRHMLFILAFMVMSANQSLMNYKSLLPQLGNNIYLIMGGILLTYLVTIYFTIYVLIPKFLMTKRYFIFGLWTVLVALLLLLMQNSIEFFNTKKDFFTSIEILDSISALFINILCLAGFSIPIFLRNWMVSSQRVSQLEKGRISSEVEQLKEQINPEFLFNILGRTSVLVKTEPKKASAMLMKLSQLLRYQLYDCDRDKVLLSSEVKFLKNFMELEKLYSPSFEYNLSSEGDQEIFFIPPLLFFGLVQIAVKSLNKEKIGNIDIHIVTKKNEATLTIAASGDFDISLSEDELSKSRERLLLLYKNNYSLTISQNKPVITLKIGNSL